MALLIKHCIALLWMIYHVTAINYLDCTSFIIESECDQYKSEGCYWLRHVGECIPINCYDFSSEREACSVYTPQYNCHWLQIPDINDAICYEHCPKLFDIVFIININDAKDAPKVLEYTKQIISIFNTTYGEDNSHFALILFSIINPVIVFDLNTGWNTQRYLNALDVAFDLKGRNSLLFNNDRSNDTKAILTGKHKVFEKSNRWGMDNIHLRKLAIYISAQNYYQIDDICSYTQSFGFDTNDISFYGAKVNHNGTFTCLGNDVQFITDKIVSYDDLYDDIGYLLSSLCPHTLIPTISPTSDPTEYPSFAPTLTSDKVMITNETCIDASKRQQFRFNVPYNGMISGVSLEYISGWRKEDKYSDTAASYWGSAVLNQFSIFIQDYSTETPLYPDFGKTRGAVSCKEKYRGNEYKDYKDRLLQFYYCWNGDDVSVNDTDFVLYSPSYSVTTNDEWSVVYVDDLLEAFMEDINQQNIGTICFAVYLLYDSMDTSLSTTTSLSITPNPSMKSSINPTPYPTQYPTSFPSKNPLIISVPSTLPPTSQPTMNPTSFPTEYPTKYPLKAPTKYPSSLPTKYPSKTPTKHPTKYPLQTPTKYPSKSPTNDNVDLVDCCEYFSDERYINIECDIDTLTLMKTYSDYLMRNKNRCLSASNCGSYGYFQDYDTVYNECQQHWLDIVMFKKKCVSMQAFDSFTRNGVNTCYLCDKHEVFYNDTQYTDGICYPSQNEELTTDFPTFDPATFDPTFDPSLYPTFDPSFDTTYLSTDIENGIIIEYSSNSKGSESKKCDDVMIKCENDDTLNICLNVIFCVVFSTAFIMFIIRCYYQTNLFKKDNATYSASALGYMRPFSDKSDVDDFRKKINVDKNKNKNEDKSKDKRHKKEKKKRKKGKDHDIEEIKKKREDKKRRKANIVAAISDSDDVELQSVLSSDD